MARHQGTGTLKVDGEPLGSYRFVFVDVIERGSHVASGHLVGNGASLAQAFDAGDVTLVRDDNGYEMRLVITDVTHEGMANVTVSGSPIP